MCMDNGLVCISLTMFNSLLVSNSFVCRSFHQMIPHDERPMLAGIFGHFGAARAPAPQCMRLVLWLCCWFTTGAGPGCPEIETQNLGTLGVDIRPQCQGLKVFSYLCGIELGGIYLTGPSCQPHPTGHLWPLAQAIKRCRDLCLSLLPCQVLWKMPIFTVSMV